MAEETGGGQEIVVVEGTAEDVTPRHPATLFRTDDPVQVVERATEVAEVLKGVLQRQGLTSRIQGREHVRVEGWTTLGSMLGVVPVVVWSRKLDDGWEARVEARTLDGRIIGAAEAQCLRAESTWKDRPDFALRSMAQTRATSKALRGPLGFVVTLAGYEATPEEEMSQAAQSEAPGYGAAAGEDLTRGAAVALKEMVGEERGLALWGDLKQRFGYMPAAAAITIAALGTKAAA